MLNEAVVESIDNGHVYVSYVGDFAFHQGFENVSNYPFEINQTVTIERPNDFGLIEAVYVDGERVVHIPEDYKQLRKDAAQLERHLNNYRRYLALKPKLQDRLDSLHPRLRARMEYFFNEEGEKEFFLDGMGEYELFIMEQATMLYETFREAATRQAVWEIGALVPNNPEAPSYLWEHGNRHWDVNSPTDALLAWWSINSKIWDYKSQLQYDLVPGWSNAHSGNTAGGAYSFARSLLRDEDEKVSH